MGADSSLLAADTMAWLRSVVRVFAGLWNWLPRIGSFWRGSIGDTPAPRETLVDSVSEVPGSFDERELAQSSWVPPNRDSALESADIDLISGVAPPAGLQEEDECSQEVPLAEDGLQSGVAPMELDEIGNGAPTLEEGDVIDVHLDPDERREDPEPVTHDDAPRLSEPAAARKRRDPGLRGGRPRSSEPARIRREDAPELPADKVRRTRMELVCWRKGMNWSVGIEVGDGSSEEAWNVRQDTGALEEDERTHGRWLLTSPCGWVTLQGGDGRELKFGSEAFRIFKLSGPSCDRGRYMRSLTNGRFLIVAPEACQPDRAMLDAMFLDSEDVTGRCRAHHIDTSSIGSAAIGFTAPTGEFRSIPTTAPAFELQGALVRDTHILAGPLFSGEPPLLRPLRDVEYASVVLGTEGPRHLSRHWRKSSSSFDRLRPDVESRQGGWFFLRLYDSSDELLESLDFRYAAGLRAIERVAEAPVPTPEGHRAGKVRLFHDSNCRVIPLGNPAPRVSSDVAQGSSTIEVAPLPILDKALCLLEHDGGGGVEIGIGMDRVWWATLDQAGDDQPPEWTDRPVVFNVVDFAATSRRVMRIRLPLGFAEGSAVVGVAPGRTVLARPVPRCRSEVEVPLRELGRFQELGAANSPAEVRLWIQRGPAHVWNCVIGRPESVALTRDPNGRALNYDDLSPVIVMGVLARLGQQCRSHGCGHRLLIREHRKKYRGRHRQAGPARDAWRAPFLREALCIIALILQEHDGSDSDVRLAGRWIRRARAAARELPSIMAGLREGRPKRTSLEKNQ